MNQCRLLVAGFALAFTACASQPSTPPTSTAGAVAAVADADAEELRETAKVVAVQPEPATSDGVVCRRERVTGTHNPRRICTTSEARRQQRAEAQEWLRSGGRQGTVTAVPTVR